MTTAVALVPLVISGLLAIFGRRAGLALSGRTAAVLLTIAALVAALGTGFMLCAIATLALARWEPLAHAGDWSAAAVAAREPLPLDVAVFCGLVALALLAASIVRTVTSVRRIGRSIDTCRRLGDVPGDLVIVDDPVPNAYALAGLPGRAVVTRSMLRSLAPDERRALLAHEAAHVRHHHYLYVQLTALAVAANPLLAPLIRAVHGAVERWADDAAAVTVGDRRLVATTLARATLATRVGAAAVLPAGALGAADTDVRERVSSLLDDPTSQTTKRFVGAAMILAIVVVGLSVGWFGVHAHDVIEWAESVRTLGRT